MILIENIFQFGICLMKYKKKLVYEFTRSRDSNGPESSLVSSKCVIRFWNHADGQTLVYLAHMTLEEVLSPCVCLVRYQGSKYRNLIH
jgi:hypothetical protein